jgi:hypothetical protein
MFLHPVSPLFRPRHAVRHGQDERELAEDLAEKYFFATESFSGSPAS